MTKTVQDCALILGAIAGYDPRDPFTSRRPVPDYTARFGSSLRGVRVGLIRELDEDAGMHPEVKQAIHNAVEVLRQQGAEVREVSIPLVALAGAIFVGVADTEGAGRVTTFCGPVLLNSIVPAHTAPSRRPGACQSV